MTLREQIDLAYRQYYAERHAMEESGASPDEWEIKLWEAHEERLVEIWRRHHDSR